MYYFIFIKQLYHQKTNHHTHVVALQVLIAISVKHILKACTYLVHLRTCLYKSLYDVIPIINTKNLDTVVVYKKLSVFAY